MASKMGIVVELTVRTIDSQNKRKQFSLGKVEIELIFAGKYKVLQLYCFISTNIRNKVH